MRVCHKHWVTDTPIHLFPVWSLWMKTSNAYLTSPFLEPIKSLSIVGSMRKKGFKGESSPQFLLLTILYLAHVSGGIVCFRIVSLEFDGGERFTQC